MSIAIYPPWKLDALNQVSLNGLRLKDASEEWRNDRAIVGTAVFQYPLAIRFIGPQLKIDKALALLAVRVNGLAKYWLGDVLRRDPDVQALAKKSIPLEYDGGEAYAKRIALGKDNRIFVPKLKKSILLNNLTGQKGLSHEFVEIDLIDRKASQFLRDSAVILFNGKHLLPYVIKTPHLNGLLLALLPVHAAHFFIDIEKGTLSNEGIFGCGFEKLNQVQAMVSGYEYDYPFKRGKTCIEGGNCFLFRKNDQPMAVIGEITVYLSMLALQEQGEFEFLQADVCDEPLPEAFRMARNFELYLDIKKPEEDKEVEAYKAANSGIEPKQVAHTEWNGALEYTKKLAAPFASEEREKYLSQARNYDTKLRKTLQCIADELEIPVTNVICLPQTQFHVDMESLVTPDGDLVLHDDLKTLDFLDEMVKKGRTLNSQEKGLWESFRKTAEMGARQFKHIQEMRLEQLKASGITTKLMAAKFESADCSLNHCNGVFSKNTEPGSNGYHFLTSGPTFEQEIVFHTAFSEVFAKEFPDYNLLGIPGISGYVAEKRGGIRCLTNQNPL